MDEVFLNLDVYVVKNILDEDIVVTFGGQPFPFKAGETRVYPKQVGEFLANKIVDRAIEKERGFDFVTNKSVRSEKLSKAFTQSEINTPKIKTPEEQVKEFINVSNEQPSPNALLDEVMSNSLSSLPETSEEGGFDGINQGVSK